MALKQIQNEMRNGSRALGRLEQDAMQGLRDRGWAPDYVAIRRRSDLLLPTSEQAESGEPLVALAAARLGTTRLIDNLEI